MRVASRINPMVVAIAIALLPGIALGQRTRFPTPVTADTAPSLNTAPSSAALTAPTLNTPPASAPQVSAAPMNAPTLSTPPSGALPGAVPVTPGTVGGPLPSYQTGVQTPAPAWDPYAPPGSAPAIGTTPSTLSPNGYTAPVIPSFGAMTATMQRLLDELRLDFVYISPMGADKFGTDDLDLSSRFAIPIFNNPAAPLYITPGFAFHWWNGPTSHDVAPDGILGVLPPRVYDAYLDTAWNPQVTPQIGGELSFRVGVYSDFSKVTMESLRYTGEGLLVVTISPNAKIKGGIVYLDRVRIKMLPAAGVFWMPNSDVKFDIYFPEPKASRRLTNIGNAELWGYVRGEYGGGSWTVTPQKGPGPMDQIDYNDIRVALGLEFNRNAGLGGLVELGTAFNRELYVRGTHEKFTPSTTIFLRAGLIY